MERFVTSNKLTDGESECRNAMESNSASRRPVRPSLNKRCDRTARTLYGHWNLVDVAVQSRGIDQPATVDRVACQGDHGVATHRAVTRVVHEDSRQVRITCEH